VSAEPERNLWARTLARMRDRVRPLTAWAMSNWPGRILLRTGAAFARLELLDRSMTLAAQLFTSIFPLLIMAAVLFGPRYGDQVADVINLPQSTRRVLDEALANGGFSSFGVLGAVIVLVSSTSLARTMIRAYGAIWQLPRTRRSVRNAWRLLAAVILLAVFFVGVRLLTRLAGHSPVSQLTSQILTLLADIALAVAVPWILLARVLPARLLLPGGVVFGAVMVIVRPAGAVYLPRALQVSAERYGTIGLAFTYIGWLYVLSVCYLGAAAIGQVLAQDEGRLGRIIRSGSAASWRTEAPGGELDLHAESR